ncbi:MAG: 5'-methylthioadenosine/S-adenosylhomocysteine nucleosidase, partial [Proteobacteria bacterium]|nr:5'-methylthioadenosine/S-adenosylhomocysteine nucleosidase [Pseudomonadota bacterium]
MKILTVFALESETQSLFTDIPILYTGVGKVNASYNLTKAITQKKPDVILNIGTAGSKKFNYGNIILCNKFIQRDMNATAFGYKPFETPNDQTPQILEYFTLNENIFDGIGICGTGDSFEINITGDEPYDVVDMEAYALAKIAKAENIPFVCVKFISDGADNNAPQNWNDSLVIGAKKMKTVFDEIQQH